MKLPARIHDDLNWVIVGQPKVFEFDLGLHLPYFPLDDKLYFSSLAASLTHFTNTVWPNFVDSNVILYRGSADFAQHFLWTERQEINFQAFKERAVLSDEEHLKRLFCAEMYVYYFQMLAHQLPDELSIKLILDPKDCGSHAKTLHLLSPERFEHFEIESSVSYGSNIGVCFPPDEECSDGILEKIDTLFEQLPSFRPVYEPLLTEQWDGLDEIYVFSGAVTEQGKRKILGFEATGGLVIER